MEGQQSSGRPDRDALEAFGGIKAGFLTRRTPKSVPESGKLQPLDLLPAIYKKYTEPLF